MPKHKDRFDDAMLRALSERGDCHLAVRRQARRVLLYMLIEERVDGVVRRAVILRRVIHEVLATF